MGTMKYRGYIGSVEFSDEDNCLFGKVLGLYKTAITYEGNTVDELRRDFHAGVDHYLSQCSERGVAPERPFSGTLNIRIPSEVHGALAVMAGESGTSINSVIKQALIDFTNQKNY